jgi:hypothetical protein
MAKGEDIELGICIPIVGSTLISAAAAAMAMPPTAGRLPATAGGTSSSGVFLPERHASASDLELAEADETSEELDRVRPGMAGLRPKDR